MINADLVDQAGEMVNTSIRTAGRPGGHDVHVSASVRSTLHCILVAVVVGALLGPFVLAGQVHAPYPLANLFNSPAVWAAAAFGFGVWAQSRMRAAVVGAIVMEVVAVMAYYLADVLVRGSDASILVSTTATGLGRARHRGRRDLRRRWAQPSTTRRTCCGRSGSRSYQRCSSPRRRIR